jgi:hypothetical protein
MSRCYASTNPPNPPPHVLTESRGGILFSQPLLIKPETTCDEILQVVEIGFHAPKQCVHGPGDLQSPQRRMPGAGHQLCAAPGDVPGRSWVLPKEHAVQPCARMSIHSRYGVRDLSVVPDRGDRLVLGPEPPCEDTFLGGPDSGGVFRHTLRRLCGPISIMSCAIPSV